jgi:hypothetical protein
MMQYGATGRGSVVVSRQRLVGSDIVSPSKWFLAVVFVVTMSSQALAQGVSRAEAEALLTRLDRAVAARDSATIAAALSENVTIDGTLTMGGQTRRFTYDKSEYLQSLVEVWAQVTEYRYLRSNQTIEVSSDRVTATADVSESTVILGQRLESRSREVSTIERVDGVPMITRVVSEGGVDALPQ